jgi:hypothetical protein
LEGEIMMKYILPMAMLFMLAGTALGTMWLYDDPAFFQIGSEAQVASFKPANISPFEIINAPYFPLLGQGFYFNAIPVKLSNSTESINIGSRGNIALSPTPVTFGGHLENNLKYAMGKSSMRIGQQGSWDTLNAPGVL